MYLSGFGVVQCDERCAIAVMVAAAAAADLSNFVQLVNPNQCAAPTVRATVVFFSSISPLCGTEKYLLSSSRRVFGQKRVRLVIQADCFTFQKCSLNILAQEQDGLVYTEHIFAVGTRTRSESLREVKWKLKENNSCLSHV